MCKMVNVIVIKFIVSKNIGDCETTGGIFGDDVLQDFQKSGFLSVLQIVNGNEVYVLGCSVQEREPIYIENIDVEFDSGGTSERYFAQKNL